MFKKLQHAIGLAVITALAPIMLAATPDTVQAQTRTEAQPATKFATAVAQPTYSFGTAAGPVAGLLQIDAKSSHWFKFKYDYDNSDSDNVPTQALVNLKMATAGCVSFDVWTPGRLQNPQHNGQDTDNRNDRVTPVGSGTPEFQRSVHESGQPNQDVFDAMTLTWAGSARMSDTYYIVVKNKTTAACTYSLAISGPDVSF
jgi:hypothetical protein